MKLTDKITSYEDYMKVVETGVPGKVLGTAPNRFAKTNGDLVVTGFNDSLYMLPYAVNGNAICLQETAQLPKELWWAHRELMRMAYGVYRKPTQAINALKLQYPFNQFFLHISNEDPTLIAYTASREDGERDRQTRMALGRFIRKNYLMISDKTVANIEAYHRTELNPPVTFLVAEGNEKEFVDAYRQINSCMSKGITDYAVKGVMHPVEAYCTPGFQLALLKNPSGSVSARSLVWINPEDPNDKRMVRTYGDLVLHNYLLNNGFELKPFEPAYVKTKVVPNSKDGHRQLIVMPYVDTGGDGSGRVPVNSARAVWDGEDRVYLLSTVTKKKVPEQYHVSSQNSNGTAYALPFPMNKVCAISGVKIDPFKDEYVDVKHEGNIVVALRSAVKDWVLIHDNSTAVLHAPTTPHFQHGAVRYMDTPANRLNMGYIQLWAEKYPNDDGAWHQVNQPTSTAISVIRGNLYVGIKKEDVVNLVVTNGTYNKVHISEVPKDAIRCASLEETKTWVLPTVRHERTEANRVVVPGVHEVVQDPEGVWHYKRQMKEVRILNDVFWIKQDQDVASLKFTTLPEAMKVRVDDAIASVTQLPNAKKKALFNAFSRMGDMLCPIRKDSSGLVAHYLFDYRDMPLKLVEEWLAADYVMPAGAPDATMQVLHRFGSMVLTRVTEIWAAKAVQPKAGVEPRTAATA